MKWPMKRSVSVLMAMLLLAGIAPGWAFNNTAIQGMHQAVADEAQAVSPVYLSPVELLWRATLGRNPTLQLALQKMAEKTGNLSPKDKSQWTQGLLQNMIRIGGMGGAVASGSALPLVGSSFLGRFTASSEAPSRLTTVTSADLVILTKEIEQAQSELLWNYIRYRNAQYQVKQLTANLESFQSQAAMVSSDQPQVGVLLNTMISQDTLQLNYARSHVLACRQLLVLAAGEAAVAEVDKLVDNDAN